MENKVFAKGYCIQKIFIFFVIGCLIGTYYEELLYFVRFGGYSDRQGLLYGPFSPIYGVGIAIFVILLGKHNETRSIVKTLILAAIIGGVTEFMTSWIADVFFEVKFWDYSGYFLNIMGRTTIPFMIVWGIGGTILMKVIYPFISKWIEKIPYHIANPLYKVLFIFIICDVILTYTVFARMAMRDEGVEPYTFIGEWIDETYDDEYMDKKFPVMSPENK